MSNKIALRARIIAAALLWNAACWLPSAHAQPAYPDRPIKLIVGFVAGGPSDVLARLITRELATELGQPIIVDNRPGADANIAMETVARSSPDGYTLLLAQSGMTINPAMYGNFKLSPTKDFTPIGMIGEAPNVLVINSELPIRSVGEFLTYAKQHPGRLNFAATSSPTRLASELINSTANVKIEMIPYKGTPPAIIDLMGGNVQAMISSVTTFQSQRQDSRLRFLATTGSKRSDLMADLPTIAEAGLAGYSAVTWYGLAGPSSLPSNVLTKLERALEAALSKPEIASQLRSMGIDVTKKSSREMSHFLERDAAKWKDVVMKSGARIQ